MKNQSNFNLTGNESVHQKDRPIHFNGDTQTQQIKSNSLYPAFVFADGKDQHADILSGLA
jgi:hypothetical protein